MKKMEKKLNKLDIFDKEIESVLKNLDLIDPTSDEYKKAVMNLEILCKARSYEKENKIDKNTVLNVGSNLMGILAILKHEQINVITSKALGFVSKIKI